MADLSAGSSSSSNYRQSQDIDSFDVGDAKVQHFGLLLKKPFGHKSARWQKRFFIVKEGFMLYYPESESKSFERSHHFNIHPKGVIPLGGCMVEEAMSGPQKFAIRITNDNFKGEIWVGADNQEDCSKWTKVLKEAGKVTWRNAQLGENVVQQLEVKSQEMATEMKEAIDKLNEEASVLEVEKEKKSELEALAAKLETEKKAIEEAARNLREEKDTAEQELQQTMEAMKQIQQEKDNLSEKTEHLKGNLQTMEEIQRELQQEKETTETSLQNLELTAQQLKQEKKQISDTALHLQQNLEQVSQEKTKTESKWKEERKRRIKTERRLHLAEDSLKRLDKALRDSGVHIDIQIETDVKNLREFFEECIKEEEYEAQKYEILRDAVKAKVSYSTESRKMSETDTDDMPVSPKGDPPSDLPTVVEGVQNGKIAAS